MIFLLPGHTPQLYKDKDILQGNRENLKKYGMFDIEFNVPGKIRTFGINVESDVLSEAFDALAIRKITGLFIAAVLPQS
jgi:hypothetical protein